MIYLHHYRVTYWCDYKECMMTEEGIIANKTLAGAVKRICTYYGDDQIEELSISSISDCELITFDDLTDTLPKWFEEEKNETGKDNS